DPECGFCLRALPELARLEADPPSGRPVPVVLAQGDASRIRTLAAEHGIACTILLDDDAQVAHGFFVAGTPGAYLVDEHGLIAAPLALGMDAISTLLNRSEATPLRVRSVEDTNLLRTGLEAGTPAPPFTLPTVAGGSLSLDEYRGRRVLLVFMDPHCGP